MADTNFTDGVTLSAAAWFQDVNDLTYKSGWTTPAFSAGDFTASGSQTWTVQAGDVTTYAYKTIGKTMIVAFYLGTTTVGGTPSTGLIIAIPNSKVATKAMYSACLVIDNGTLTAGYAAVSASGTTITVARSDGANMAASTNNTTVTGQIAFEIN